MSDQQHAREHRPPLFDLRDPYGLDSEAETRWPVPYWVDDLNNPTWWWDYPDRPNDGVVT